MKREINCEVSKPNWYVYNVILSLRFQEESKRLGEEEKDTCCNIVSSTHDREAVLMESQKYDHVASPV